MTPRQRVLAVLRGEKPDKVPFTVYESMIPQCSVERRLREEGLCIVNRRHNPIAREAPNCIEESHRYTEKGRPRVRSITRTPVGEVSTLAEPADFTTWTLEHLFKGPEDYAPLLYMIRDWQYRPAYDDYLTAERWMGEDVILRGGVGSSPLHRIMIHWMGVETFAVEWMERRDEVLKLEAAWRSAQEPAYEILANSPITHANFGGNESPEVMGPERYREFCVPLYRDCAEVFHAQGKLLGSHLDANNRAWADAVASSGLDYVEAFTPSPDTDLTLAEALDAWPDKVLWINFPSSIHLARVEEIRRVAREIVDLGMQTSRVIIGITENIPPDRWQESLLTISEVINEA
jgi:hypothetical protein